MKRTHQTGSSPVESAVAGAAGIQPGTLIPEGYEIESITRLESTDGAPGERGSTRWVCIVYRPIGGGPRL